MQFFLSLFWSLFFFGFSLSFGFKENGTGNSTGNLTTTFPETVTMGELDTSYFNLNKYFPQPNQLTFEISSLDGIRLSFKESMAVMFTGNYSDILTSFHCIDETPMFITMTSRFELFAGEFFLHNKSFWLSPESAVSLSDKDISKCDGLYSPPSLFKESQKGKKLSFFLFFSCDLKDQEAKVIYTVEFKGLSTQLSVKQLQDQFPNKNNSRNNPCYPKFHFLPSYSPQMISFCQSDSSFDLYNFDKKQQRYQLNKTIDQMELVDQVQNTTTPITNLRLVDCDVCFSFLFFLDSKQGIFQLQLDSESMTDGKVLQSRFLPPYIRDKNGSFTNAECIFLGMQYPGSTRFQLGFTTTNNFYVMSFLSNGYTTVLAKINLASDKKFRSILQFSSFLAFLVEDLNSQKNSSFTLMVAQETTNGFIQKYEFETLPFISKIDSTMGMDFLLVSKDKGNSSLSNNTQLGVFGLFFNDPFLVIQTDSFDMIRNSMDKKRDCLSGNIGCFVFECNLTFSSTSQASWKLFSLFVLEKSFSGVVPLNEEPQMQSIQQNFLNLHINSLAAGPSLYMSIAASIFSDQNSGNFSLIQKAHFSLDDDFFNPGFSYLETFHYKIPIQDTSFTSQIFFFGQKDLSKHLFLQSCNIDFREISPTSLDCQVLASHNNGAKNNVKMIHSNIGLKMSSSSTTTPSALYLFVIGTFSKEAESLSDHAKRSFSNEEAGFWLIFGMLDLDDKVQDKSMEISWMKIPGNFSVTMIQYIPDSNYVLLYNSNFLDKAVYIASFSVDDKDKMNIFDFQKKTLEFPSFLPNETVSSGEFQFNFQLFVVVSNFRLFLFRYAWVHGKIEFDFINTIDPMNSHQCSESQERQNISFIVFDDFFVSVNEAEGVICRFDHDFFFMNIIENNQTWVASRKASLFGEKISCGADLCKKVDQFFMIKYGDSIGFVDTSKDPNSMLIGIMEDQTINRAIGIPFKGGKNQYSVSLFLVNTTEGEHEIMSFNPRPFLSGSFIIPKRLFQTHKNYFRSSIIFEIKNYFDANRLIVPSHYNISLESLKISLNHHEIDKTYKMTVSQLREETYKTSLHRYNETVFNGSIWYYILECQLKIIEDDQKINHKADWSTKKPVFLRNESYLANQIEGDNFEYCHKDNVAYLRTYSEPVFHFDPNHSSQERVFGDFKDIMKMPNGYLLVLSTLSISVFCSDDGFTLLAQFVPPENEDFSQVAKIFDVFRKRSSTNSSKDESDTSAFMVTMFEKTDPYEYVLVAELGIPASASREARELTNETFYRIKMGEGEVNSTQVSMKGPLLATVYYLQYTYTEDSTLKLMYFDFEKRSLSWKTLVTNDLNKTSFEAYAFDMREVVDDRHHLEESSEMDHQNDGSSAQNRTFIFASVSGGSVCVFYLVISSDYSFSQVNETVSIDLSHLLPDQPGNSFWFVSITNFTENSVSLLLDLTSLTMEVQFSKFDDGSWSQEPPNERNAGSPVSMLKNPFYNVTKNNTFNDFYECTATIPPTPSKKHYGFLIKSCEMNNPSSIFYGGSQKTQISAFLLFIEGFNAKADDPQSFLSVELLANYELESKEFMRFTLYNITGTDEARFLYGNNDYFLGCSQLRNNIEIWLRDPEYVLRNMEDNKFRLHFFAWNHLVSSRKEIIIEIDQEQTLFERYWWAFFGGAATFVLFFFGLLFWMFCFVRQKKKKVIKRNQFNFELLQQQREEERNDHLKKTDDFFS